jgi:hypothetical protein
MEKYELPYLYWIPKLLKNPYKKTYSWIQQSLSLLLTKILTAVKEKI